MYVCFKAYNFLFIQTYHKAGVAAKNSQPKPTIYHLHTIKCTISTAIRKKSKKNVFQIASELYILNKVWLMNQNALRLKRHKENEQRRANERIST